MQVFFYVWRKNSEVDARKTQFSGFKRKEVRHTLQFALLSMILLCKIILARLGLQCIRLGGS
jgi:hypothetical protein